MNQKLKSCAAKILSKNDTVKYAGICVWNMIGRTNYIRKYARKYHVKQKLIVFESFGGRQYSCSPRALYEELCRNPLYKDYKKIWAFQDPEKHRYLEKDPDTKVVAYHSEAYYKAYAMAKVWVSNFRLGNELQPKKNQIYIQTWHGTPLKRLGFDIENFNGSKGAQRELEYQYSSDVKRYSYLLSPSQFYKEKITGAFGLEKFGKTDIFIDGGYPRNDFLLRLTDKKKEELKAQMDIPDDKKVILYAPTWRETEHEPGCGYRYKLAVDFDKWRRALGEDVLILYRSHYFISNEIDLRPYEGFVRNVSDYDDINDLYAVSDMLITDYSSVFFDYANLNRPIVFFMYDYEQYKNELRGFYIDEVELPGPIVKDEDDLLKVLGEYQGQGYESVYQAFNEKYNPYRTGDGAAVVWRHVLPKESAGSARDSIN